LGDFSPLGRLFTAASFLKNTQLAQICLPLISKVIFLINYNKKMAWDSFWAIF
jgi:hypothetical protein